MPTLARRPFLASLAAAALAGCGKTETVPAPGAGAAPAGKKLKVAFLPNYNVSLAETIMPAADLSEQISTAGMEASGTGNMKFMANGALTIGTLDGANVEMLEEVGPDNMLIFGLTADQVAEKRARSEVPRSAIDASPALREALEAIATGVFSPDDPHRYRDLIGGLYDHDWFMVARDFDRARVDSRQFIPIVAEVSA